MTVHFQGISEYQNKYKAGHRRPHRRMRLAGLRSDQLGISREPRIQSKRRVPVCPPQVSRSLQWKGSSVSPRQEDITKPGTPPVLPVVRGDSEDKVKTPLAPRASKPLRASRTSQLQEEAPSAQTKGPSADQQNQGTPKNQVNHALRRKADLKTKSQQNGVRDSEYHRQFHWKTPMAESPLLTAQQMFYASNRRIPPFTSGPVVLESEYMQSFKGSPPPKPPCLRRDVELNAVPLTQMENRTPDKWQRKKKRQNQKEQHLRGTSWPEEEALAPEPQPPQHQVRSPRAQNSASLKVMRKAKTEYSTNFRSPLQYCYRDGVWAKTGTRGEEVRELREKAEAYRKRAWGTHFSRQHLSQILSAQNYLWEASSCTSNSCLSEEDHRSTRSPIIEALDLARVDSVRGSSGRGTSVSLTSSRRSSIEGAEVNKDLTLPVRRKLAWEEEGGPSEKGLTQERKEPPFQQGVEEEGRGGIHGNTEDIKDEVTVAESEFLSPEVVSEHLNEEGRVPTPELKTMLGTRTHHDRTTPTTGGAVLVSPPKTNCKRRERRSEPPLGKVHSPYRHLSHGSPPQAHSKAENGALPYSAQAAGMATIDPLPLNEDLCAADCPPDSPEPAPVRRPHKRATSFSPSAASSPQSNRIQGTLRNPEFQHNGNLGLQRSGIFLLPSSDSGVSDNDDKMSEISCRSATSCLRAARVLDRAQRRKEDFWGKSC
ncbi:nuclear protein MDM1 isoform X2 [Brachyhypopomus gauderio]|uniref:nuclear protein MDM1 isoform X2 n=1 Tax=Brachyhypopomus gauderio TaxID=698409 RepID=UPI00404281AB